MPIRILPLTVCLTVLAPSASAFGAMDCVARELCTPDGCTQSFMVFALTFDWAAQDATVEMDGDTTRLSLAANDVADDFASGALTYINADDAGMILDFDTNEITMTLYPGDGSSHIASCAAREAA